MSKVRIGVAGANGAFGSKHLDALSQIEKVEIVAAMATTLRKANGVADKYSIPNRFDNYDQMLGLSDLDAVILATPTQIHAEQGLKAMAAGKHVLIEIPMADTLADSEALVAKQKESGLWRWRDMFVGLIHLISGSTIKLSRVNCLFNRWIFRPISSGELI